jgi:protocatechuate 3,4-dioxygenase beta subunit
VIRATTGAVGLALLLAPGGDGAESSGSRTPEPVVGLPCERCEDVFVGLPETVPSRARIAPAGEPGEPMRIEGTVRDGTGRATGGVIVYAYHTDATGRYPRVAPKPGTPFTRHGRLRGWARTDEQGRYVFDTIRPAAYPDSDDPAHVHMHVIEPGRCTYYIDDIVFEDDPRLTPAKRRWAERGRGGPGVAAPSRDEAGTWVVVRDVVLGAAVLDYPPRDPPAP